VRRVTAAAFAFTCTVLLALLEGYGRPAFVAVIVSQAFSVALPFLAMLFVARFATRRAPESATAIAALHAGATTTVAVASFGWWWLEPHAVLTSVTGSTMSATAWLGAAGIVLGTAIARGAARTSEPALAREVATGAVVAFLLLGGRAYRAFDHVEAGMRLQAGFLLVGGFVAAGVLAWFLLRGRERLASGIPALLPAVGAVLLLAASRAEGPPPARGDSVLVVLVDTLRADIADEGFAGQTETMPHLARIAAEGTRFTQAISPAPWTLPATMSLVSGWNPHRHGFGRSTSAWDVTQGDPGALHLGPSLREAGYLSAAFVHNPWLRPYYGFARDFFLLRPYHGRAMDGLALAVDWMHSTYGTGAFTLLHLMDPHWPFDAPDGYGPVCRPCEPCESLVEVQYQGASDEVREELRRRYTAEVAYTDTMLGLLWDELGSAGHLERTWVIVTSDHGEEFWEHDRFLHGHSLHDVLLRVPLVVVPPRGRDEWKRGARIEAQVRLEDVGATILDVTGLDTALARDGASLLPLLRGEVEAGERAAVAGYIKSPVDRRYAVRRPPWKAVLTPGVPLWSALYDLKADPGETRSVLFDREAAPLVRLARGGAFRDLSALPAQLDLDVERVPDAPSSPSSPDADTARRLRSLGYAD